MECGARAPTAEERPAPTDVGGGGENGGLLRLDPITRELSYLGRTIRLTPAQASVMHLLTRAAPDPVPREAIWRAIRGYVPARPTAAPRVLMHALREACRKAFGEDLVETVLGKGYRLRPGLRVEALTEVSEN